MKRLATEWSGGLSQACWASHSNFRNFDPTEMIEMDRFVVTLEGTREELVIRHSRQSSSTMKEENDMTINRIAQLIEDMVTNSGGEVTDSFCGLPHHMFLPRSGSFSPRFRSEYCNQVNREWD